MSGRNGSDLRAPWEHRNRRCPIAEKGDEMTSTESTVKVAIRPMIKEAVDQAQNFVHADRGRFQSDMDGELLLLGDRLDALRAKHQRKLADLFDHLEGNSIQKARRKQREDKIEETFAAWWDWIEKTRETPTDPNPYVRLVAVFRG